MHERPPDPTGAAQVDPADVVFRTRGLTKRFGRRAAVSDLSVAAVRGRITGLLGPNGSGKSTTLRMLLGLIRPTAGDAEVLGCSIDRPTAYLPRVGALIEAPVHDRSLTAARFLEALALVGGHDPARVEAVLAEVGLADRARDRVDDFSLGMRQRVGIAAALLPDPELLVLDEPTNGLDPAGIVEIRALLRHQVAVGRSVLVSSHLLAEMELLCDDVLVLTDGRCLYQGSLDALRARYPGELRTVEMRPGLEEIFLDLTRRATARTAADPMEVAS